MSSSNEAVSRSSLSLVFSSTGVGSSNSDHVDQELASLEERNMNQKSGPKYTTLLLKRFKDLRYACPREEEKGYGEHES